MHRPRRRRDLGSSFTFGGRLPGAVGFVLVLIGVVTLGSWMAPDRGAWAFLRSGAILGGELWRLVAYPLVQEEPTALVFGALAIWFFGPWLAIQYGERWFLGYLLLVTVGSALVTHALGAVFGVGFAFVGVWPLVDAVVLLWALQNQHQRVLLMFVLPVSGRILAIITVALNVLWALWGMSRDGLAGLLHFMPPLASLGIAYVVHRGGIRLPLRRWRLGLREWNMERQLRRRSKHLHVVGKAGQRGKQWMN